MTKNNMEIKEKKSLNRFFLIKLWVNSCRSFEVTTANEYFL
jgi:hypothetical protein